MVLEENDADFCNDLCEKDFLGMEDLDDYGYIEQSG
jgi:hypothetical protein